MESMPCSNCIKANVDCQVTESRRGKYARRPKRPNSTSGNTLQRRPESSPLVEPNQPMGEAAVEPQDAEVFLGESAVQPQDAEVFLGESTLIRSVHNDFGARAPYRSAKSQLRYPMPAAPSAPEWERHRKNHRLEALAGDGALTLPTSSVRNELLTAYFDWFHPCFPVVNRSEIIAQANAGDLSPMLCYAIMFIGVIHYKQSKFHLIGLEINNREEARHFFYNRAKDLYDADYESNSTVILQTMFLLSFWRAGPLLQKDSRYWLGGAISLAQTKAMHRSSGPPDCGRTKLRKRLWWSIYVRERQCAAALGLPNRIRDEDCDVEALVSTDLEEPNAETHISDNIYGSPINVLFAIEMAGLACLLGKIVHGEYMPGKEHNGAGKHLLRTELNNWASRLPAAFHLGNETGDLFLGMLHMAYNNLLILLYRPAFIAGEEGQNHQDGQMAYQAACRISRIAEDLLADGSIGHGQIHMITCLFNALCIHTINLRRVEGTSRIVAEHRAKICLYGLRELQKTWEVTNWVLQLFFRYLDRSMAHRLGDKEHEYEETHETEETTQDKDMDPPTTTDFPAFSPNFVTNILHPSDSTFDMPLSYGSNIFGRSFGEGYADFPMDSICNLEGITPADLELLAGCLT